MSLSRRDWLGATLALGAGCRKRAGAPAPDTVEALIARMTTADAEASLSLVLDVLAAGAPAERVLAASFLLPVVTEGDREDVHAILVVPSIDVLTISMPKAARDLAVAWAAHDAHAWMGPRRGALTNAQGPATIDGMLAAIGNGDAAAAHTAAEAIAARGDLDSVLDALTIEGTRPRADPHGAIYVAQATRFLGGAALPFAPRVVGSVARLLARSPAEGPDPAPFNATIVHPMSSADLAAELRRTPAARLDGLAPESVWGALALLVVETMLVDDSVSGLGPHRTTLLDALAHLHRRAPPAARGLILARAVDWIPRVHARLGAAARPPVSSLEPSEGGYRPGPAMHGEGLFRRALGQAISDERAFVEATRQHTIAHATGEHDFKHPAAVLTLAPHLPDDVRARWLAGASLAFVMRSEGRWAQRDRVTARLR